MHGVRGEFRLILAEWVNTIYVIGGKRHVQLARERRRRPTTK